MLSKVYRRYSHIVGSMEAIFSIGIEVFKFLRMSLAVLPFSFLLVILVSPEGIVLLVVLVLSYSILGG